MQGTDFFRSEEMSLLQLYIPSELGHVSISELGRLGLLQFRDLNPQTNLFRRSYASNLKRLDEMERRLKFIITQSQVTLSTPLPEPEESLMSRDITIPHSIEELESILTDTEDRLIQLNTSFEELSQKQIEFIERKHVLTVASLFLDDLEHNQEINITDSTPAALSSTSIRTIDDIMESAASTIDSKHAASIPFMSSINLGIITGMVSRQKSPILEGVLWRALRGNLYMHITEIQEPIIHPFTNEHLHKNVFIISAHGKESISKIRRLCESLGATLYSVEDQRSVRAQRTLELVARIEDIGTLLYNTKQTKTIELEKVSPHLLSWLLYIRQEKLSYQVMNNCTWDANRKYLVAEAWAPRSSVSIISQSLHQVGEQSKATVHTIINEIPTPLVHPTYHKTNKFTFGFQQIIDAYGIASYREINPGLFTIITFPFLFAVMFGDFGHGLLMSIFAAWMVIKENALKKTKGGEMWQMVFGGRYIILLMGLFSMYMGLIYNDVFSRCFKFFASTFQCTDTECTHIADSVYPFGIDYQWIGSSNALTFLNSYKMKQAIVLGVIQMMFGIVLGGMNMYYFEDYYGLIGVFLPQLLFMSCTFGYLALMIVFKWITQNPESPSPSLLTMLINMVLKPGKIEQGDQLYSGQGIIQTVLIVIAVICIPWMLLFKPLMLRRKHKKEGNEMQDVITVASGRTDGFDFKEELVHQGIHTIEFVLGSVSNTASYLRLWALSLAHAQLSEVLWTMIAEKAPSNFGLAIFCFAFWFILTIAILIIMEGLSAFLHALRLHWVEFNNKFYQGGGIPFEPFTFKSVDTSLDMVSYKKET